MTLSRAFTKEDSQHEGVIVVARAPLPDDVENLVTPRGLALLQEEETELRGELARLDGRDEQERRAAELEVALEELLYRLGRAVVLDPAANDKSVVRFGDTVTVEPVGGGAPFDLTIVGVDEADPDTGMVSFLAPIAQSLLGCTPGQVTAGGARAVKVLGIA